MTIYYKNGFYDDTDGGFVPEGATPITDDQYITLLKGQAEGRQIVQDSKGTPILVEPQPSPLHTLNPKTLVWELSEDNAKELLLARLSQYATNIDNKAAEIYNIWTRFEIEYTARRDAALKFKEANYEGDPGIYVTSFALSAKIDNKTATSIILQQADLLQKVQDDLAAIRMRKFELKRAETLEQLTDIYNDIMSAIDQLYQQYKDA